MKTNFLTLSLSLIALVISVYVLLGRKQEYVFVDLKYLFENFEYKKMLERDFDRVVTYRKQEIDSLELDYRMSYNSDSGNQTKLVQKADYLGYRKRQYQEDNLALSQELDKKIYKQLKAYIRDYAKEKDVQLVIGEMEDNLNMVGQDEQNQNNELVAFVNKKFNNK